jgi:hypothetical protein
MLLDRWNGEDTQLSYCRLPSRSVRITGAWRTFLRSPHLTVQGRFRHGQESLHDSLEVLELWLRFKFFRRKRGRKILFPRPCLFCRYRPISHERYGSPQEFVKPLFSLSFRDWGCGRPIPLGGIGSESPPMFTGVSAQFEAHRRRQPESGPFPSSRVFPRCGPVSAKDPRLGCGNTPPGFARETQTARRRKAALPQHPVKSMITPIIDSFAALRIGRPTPLRERAVRQAIDLMASGGRIAQAPTNPKDDKTLKSTPIGISTNSRGEPPF